MFCLESLKKLALVLIIFMLMTKTSKEVIVLDQILYIYHSIWFNNNNVQILINFDNKSNVITIAYPSKLGF